MTRRAASRSGPSPGALNSSRIGCLSNLSVSFAGRSSRPSDGTHHRSTSSRWMPWLGGPRCRLSHLTFAIPVFPGVPHDIVGFMRTQRKFGFMIGPISNIRLRTRKQGVCGQLTQCEKNGCSNLKMEL